MFPKSSPEIRVCVIEGHKSLRTALSAVFDGTPGFRCVGAAAAPEEVWARFLGATPQVAVVGLCVSTIDGAECLRRLRRRMPQLRIVVLSHFKNAEQLIDVLKAGASGCVLKPAALACVIEAVTAVQRGEGWISPPLARFIFDYFQTLPGNATLPETKLTPREREILFLAKHGLSNDQIAGRLRVKYHTTRTHLRNIYEKLEVGSRGEAVAKYFCL